MTVKATDASFEQEVLKSDTPVLVDFWSEWCGPCRMIGPSLEDIAKEMDGKLKVVKVNIDENPMAPTRYGVRSIPTLLLFKNGQVDRLAVTAREVLIVDYKTNRPPPVDAEGVALAYRRQLALYRALLGKIYPSHQVRAFLLWTATPRLMEIDAETLDSSMPYSGPP